MKNGGKRSARQSNYGSIVIDENVEEIDFDVKCSYLEIYNENILDLLDHSTVTKIVLREDKDRAVYAEPCNEIQVTSIEEIVNLIKKGASNRSIACTNMNRESSRSHAVFSATIKTMMTMKSGEKKTKISKFHIVDLAGSERSKETGAEGVRLKEASNINKSLMTLGAVINDLSD